MKIGYPCINLTLPCRAGRTFRLKSYSDERLIDTLDGNLSCLCRILSYNAEHGILFFRITSDLVPFASHPVCTCRWQEHFAQEFQEIGAFIRDRGMRVSMHPDQFIVLNSPREEVVARSVRELAYHAEVLDLMHLDCSARIQLHVGGVYGDKPGAMERFVSRYAELDEAVLRRLVIENDDRLYTVADCLVIHDTTGVPILFDTFHHLWNSSGEPVRDAVGRCGATWAAADGIPMIDYSSPNPGERPGKHPQSIDIADFSHFLEETAPLDFDVMLEIKDKEHSALRAIAAARSDPRFIGGA
ncbi:MAG TPA: UV DNA damage repair endonuclease UvsE [Methanoculleus sp.]|nr:UV DNA damage repair endonuclease UvsE [Methanoculleus sp.]